MIKLLHFADAHIDLARHGRRDSESGLPLRVLDFLNALDTIVETAIAEKVDLAIFAGDAYRDRSPAPTYQREWGKRIKRLSSHGILTLMVVGNHDISPALGRAHTLQEFDTLEVPHTRVIDHPVLLGPNQLNGLNLQVIGIPWFNRSDLAAHVKTSDADKEEPSVRTMERIINELLDKVDPDLPTVLTSHLSVQGATYGNERSVMLGRDLALPATLLRDERLDYVALGHIHKAQNLNEGGHHPVIYPGSIERVDFGEANDRKTCVIAEIKRHHTHFLQIDLPGRRFLDLDIEIGSQNDVLGQILSALPDVREVQGSMLRLVIRYPREWEAFIDEPAIRKAVESAFEFHFIRRPIVQTRIRLAEQEHIATLPPQKLLELFWDTNPPTGQDSVELLDMASDIIRHVETGSEIQTDGGLPL